MSAQSKINQATRVEEQNERAWRDHYSSIFPSHSELMELVRKEDGGVLTHNKTFDL